MAEELDPFEGRLMFVDMLRKLTASQHSVTSVARFALSHPYLHEELYSCLVEELEQATVNARINLFFVVDAICQLSQKHRFTGYVDLIGKDLSSLVQTVVPGDRSADVNLQSTRKVLLGWRHKNLFPAEEINLIIEPLQERIANIQTKPPPASEFSKEEIFKRIEEDRERHKRLREEDWVRTEDRKPDFDEAWETTSDLNERDAEEMERENRRYLATVVGRKRRASDRRSQH